MRRGVVALVTVVAVGLGAGSADAAVTKGKYTGKTAKGDPMGLKVDGQQRVYAYFYEGVKLKCSDGDTVETPVDEDRIETPSTKPRFPITPQRRWGIRARNDELGFGWDVAGRFNRRSSKTTGKLSIFATFNEKGQQDPDGSIRCEVNNLKFTLRRR